VSVRQSVTLLLFGLIGATYPVYTFLFSSAAVISGQQGLQDGGQPLIDLLKILVAEITTADGTRLDPAGEAPLQAIPAGVVGAGGGHRLGHHVLTADAVEGVFELLDEFGTAIFALRLDFRPQFGVDDVGVDQRGDVFGRPEGDDDGAG